MMIDEKEEFTVGPKNKRGCNNLPLSKESQSIALKLMEEEEEGESHLGTSAMSVKNDDPRVTAMSGSGMMLKTLPSTLEETNPDIKQQLRKEIRKFGRKYEGIFKLLEGIQGPLEVKQQMVEFAIKEAARFKRRHLIQQLEMVLEELHSEYILNTTFSTMMSKPVAHHPVIKINRVLCSRMEQDIVEAP
ncbi:integrator complex subunit 6-like [Hipposideros larvatus]